MPRQKKKRYTDDLQVVPPTKLQCQNILFSLRQGRFLEHAALLAGVSTRVLNKWIELGRKNVPGYVEFTDVVDRADAELGDKLMTGIMNCIAEGDTQSLKWLYDKRLSPKEKHLQAKWLEEQDAAEESLSEDTEIIDLEEAEKLLEASLTASEGDLH